MNKTIYIYICPHTEVRLKGATASKQIYKNMSDGERSRIEKQGGGGEMLGL